MNLGIVIYSNDAETVWNAFRLGVFASKQGDNVKTFLLGKGVESETLDTDKFMVTDKMQEYVDAGGEILACGTCLKIHNSGGSEMCSLTTMQDLYDLINESDKVISI